MRDIKPEEDGVTHINVYSKGKTELGRFLSNFAHTPFKCRDGRFESVEGYWYWLKTGDNKLRRLYGYLAKKHGQQLERQMVGHNPLQFVPDFKERIEDAVIAKLDANPERKEELAKTDLPLEHYYAYGDKVVEPKDDWFIDMLRDLHKVLREV